MSFNKIYLDPENETLGEIMGNSKTYHVPAFQRDYSWGSEQLDELWQDIEHMRTSRTQHFMGYLVLQTQDGESFNIIDGQQRITTLILLIVVVLSRFQALVEQGVDPQDNQERLDTIHRTYLGVKSVVTLSTAPKLSLNRNNQQHYKEIIDLPYQVPKVRNLTQTNRKLNKAFEFFAKRLSQYRSTELAKLIEDLTRGLLFTTITVQDDLDAYLVFETLNARGVHLSAPDLLKNFLLATLAHGKHTTEHLEECEQIWEGIIEQLGETNFTAFLRSYEGIFSPLKHKKDLYRFLKSERITQAEKVVPYIRDLKVHAPIYAALQNPDDDYWKEHHPERYQKIKDVLSTLSMFNIKTPLSLLMTLYRRFDLADFIKISHWIAIIAIRYNVICQKTAKEQEEAYNRLANAIAGSKITTLEPIQESLMPVYPSDDEFVSAFSIKTMPSRQSSKKIVFLLTAIEQHVSGGNEVPANLTLEHVLPANPTDDWQASFGCGTYAQAIDRMGNFALLKASKNRDLGQAGFEQKRAILRQSGMSLNARIAQFAEWDIDNLNQHQKWLAQQAKSVWRIN